MVASFFNNTKKKKKKEKEKENTSFLLKLVMIKDIAISLSDHRSRCSLI
jgi:hypothetical protein